MTYPTYQTPDYSLLGGAPQQPGLRVPQQQPAMQQPMQGAAPSGQLDPALVQHILAMQQLRPQQTAIDRQMKLADAMRADASGQLNRGHMAGQMYVAPNVANLAASVFGNYMAGRKQSDAEQKEQNLGVQRQDAYRRYYDAMTGNKVE
jgi:hypothetical protein